MADDTAHLSENPNAEIFTVGEGPVRVHKGVRSRMTALTFYLVEEKVLRHSHQYTRLSIKGNQIMLPVLWDYAVLFSMSKNKKTGLFEKGVWLLKPKQGTK